MLEHIPATVGRLLSSVRAGTGALMLADNDLVPSGTAPAAMTLESPAFAADGSIPARFTEDGDGRSPPLRWSGVPASAVSLVLVVEDADSPTPNPLVHAVVTGLEAMGGALDEGAIGEAVPAGRNSFRAHAWLPPDPPPGHGAHRYVFQLYAADATVTLAAGATRAAVRAALRGHVVGLGVLVGTYERPA